MSTDLQFKSLSAPFAVKSVDKGARSFKGLASTWERDQGGDMLTKGAFSRTLAHWKQNGRTIALTDGHPEMLGMGQPQVDRILGKMAIAEETDAGLDAEFKMVPNNPRSDIALDMIEGGFLTGLSITYKAMDVARGAATKDHPWGTRDLHEVKLWSIGLVIHPMNQGSHANPASVKSMLDAMRAGTLTDDDKAALLALPDEHKAALRALLDAPSAPAAIEQPPADTPKGLAPDAPERIAMESLLRDITLRSLATA